MLPLFIVLTLLLQLSESGAGTCAAKYVCRHVWMQILTCPHELTNMYRIVLIYNAANLKKNTSKTF